MEGEPIKEIRVDDPTIKEKKIKSELIKKPIAINKIFRPEFENN